tara:strand:- start:31 stop:399 length:369 start_codon:yes stop_codon:yes gene_type:complete
MSQTITRKADNVSVYILHDDATVDLSATPHATVRGNTGGPVDFNIADLNSSNAEVHTGVTAPSGWMGGKHTYDGSSWGDASGWVHPRAQDLESEKARYAGNSIYSSTFTDAIQTEIDRIKAL